MSNTNEFGREDENQPAILDSLTHQRSARNDPSMRDGDSGHGNPYESGDNPNTTDTDVQDAAGVELDTADAEVVREGVPAGSESEPVATEELAAPQMDSARNESLSADAVGALVDADDKSDQNHTAEAGPTTEEVSAMLGEDRGVEPDRGPPPIEGYDSLTVPQILERVETLPPEQVRAVRDYEAAHRNRKTLLTHLDRHLTGRRRRRSAATQSDQP